MKAAVYKSFSGPIIIEDLPRPTAPPSGVVIQVMATGVCRSDWHGWKGHDSDIINHGLPFVPGHEVSGIIVEVGVDVTKFKLGDRVVIPFILSCGHCFMCCKHNRPTICENQEQPGFTMNGSFAEYLALPRADRNLSMIPDRVSFIEASALGCRFTTAFRAVVQQGGLKSNNIFSVAVFGCGGLGLSCVMIAAAYGAKQIVAVDVTDKALEKAKEVGATDTVNATTSSDVQKKVIELTNGLGSDLTIDAAGFKATCEDAIHCTRRGGRMVQVGLPIGGQTPTVPMGMIAGKELEIVGSHGCDARDMPAILSLVESGKLDPKKLIEREVSLEEGAKALMDMDIGSPIGMVMITQFTDKPRSRY
jgi:alcohol dehydrogenase